MVLYDKNGEPRKVSMKLKLFGLALLSAITFTGPSDGATTTKIRPKMRAVVTCVYDIVRSNSNLISTEVFSVGNYMYVIEYKFEQNGIVFTGAMGINDGIDSRGDYSYFNETPEGQPDDHGLVELNFLREEIPRAMKQCHLMPTFDSMKGILPSLPPPRPVKVIMPGQTK